MEFHHEGIPQDLGLLTKLALGAGSPEGLGVVERPVDGLGVVAPSVQPCEVGSVGPMTGRSRSS